MSNLKPYIHPTEVRFRDIDGLGHINNVVFLSYIEQCRTYWLDKAGLGSTFSMGHSVPIILARSEIDYLKQGLTRDQLEVHGWISRVGHKSFDMGYKVISRDRGLLARAVAVLVWFNFDQNQSIAIPEPAKAVLNEHLM